MAARVGSQADAVQAVFGNTDLLENILARVHPTLFFGKRKGLPDDEPCARWAASHVSRLFRETSLRLPWRVSWDGRSSTEFLAICAKPGRNLQSLGISVRQQTVSDGTRLLRYAGSVRDLQLTCWGGRVLHSWLQCTSEVGEGFLQGKSVLEYLSSLKKLTSLRVGSEGRAWGDAVWLSELSQLSRLELHNFVGAPVSLGLPDLKSLRIADRHYCRVDLTQWAVPGLTDLQLVNCHARRQETLSDCCSRARALLPRLQRLTLCDSCLDPPDIGLEELVPSLTHLALDSCRESGYEYGSVILRGLPTTLRELRVRCQVDGETAPIWSAIFALKNLVSLTVTLMVSIWQKGWCRVDLPALAEGLSSLPRLKLVDLTLSAKPGLKSSLRDLDALLRSRGGSLSVTYVQASRF